MTSTRPSGLGIGCTQPLLGYAFTLTAILGKVVEKLQDCPCKRIIVITLMTQHDLVLGLSGHVQPDPSDSAQPAKPAYIALQSDPSQKSDKPKNLHAWLLEPQQSRDRASLRQWQQESRLLRGDQPDQYMRQSGPFLQSGASAIRWTSGHPL